MLVDALQRRGPVLEHDLHKLRDSRPKGAIPEILSELLPGKDKQEKELLAWVQALNFTVPQLGAISGEYGLKMLEQQLPLKQVSRCNG